MCADGGFVLDYWAVVSYQAVAVLSTVVVAAVGLV